MPGDDVAERLDPRPASDDLSLCRAPLAGFIVRGDDVIPLAFEMLYSAGVVASQFESMAGLPDWTATRPA